MVAFVDWLNAVAIVIAAVVTTFGGVAIARMNKSVKQINRAVNHVSEGAPTLVQRVSLIERQNAVHRRWEQQVFNSFASQLGVKLPPPPPSESYIPTAEEKDVPS